MPAERVTLVATSENEVPLPDGGADRILLINVLHHVWDEPAALSELRRLLAPDGRLVVVEFAQMDRPVGPPNDHVLSFEQLLDVVAGLGRHGARDLPARRGRQVPRRAGGAEAAGVRP